MKRLVLMLALVAGLSLLAPQPAHAYELFKGTCSNGNASSSTLCSHNGGGANPLTGCDSQGNGCGNGILMKIVNIIAYVAGAAAIILIIIGAIRYITSGSDTSVGSRIDDDVLNAKRTITNALIGLAVIILAKVIITYVIVKLS